MLDYHYPSENFLITLENASQKLRQIGQGKEIGQDYERIKKMLIAYAYSPNSDMVFDSQNDIRRVLSVLIQEVSNENDVLQLLIEKSKLNFLFKAISEQLDDEYKNLITKKLLYLYYGRYFRFESLSKKEGFYFYQLLNTLVQEFEGKNILVAKAKENHNILNGELYQIIAKYGNLKTIYKELAFLKYFEIWQRIQILFLLEQVKQWQANQWDNSVETILKQILEYKTVMVGQRNLLEETVFLVIQKCKSVNTISENWLDFIFKEIGDPRILRYQNTWLRIGDEYYRWLRAKLSQDDVRAFLTNMTDGQGDDIYQYRRQFWLQYIKFVQYAKVMINPTGIKYIEKNNKEMYNRFNSSPETYSRLNDVHRSCIFMDFGSFYVIEGTHSAKLRFYKNNPILLSKRKYRYEEFYTGDAYRALIEDFNHANSANYYWQNLARVFISDNFKIHIPLDNMILDSDKNRLRRIKEHLHNSGQSID